jgi:hypothetical protein
VLRGGGEADPDQVRRLEEFRKLYPDVVIEPLRRGGVWQARIPEDSGETVVTRYSLRELLDKLAELLGEPDGGGSG